MIIPIPNFKGSQKPCLPHLNVNDLNCTKDALIQSAKHIIFNHSVDGKVSSKCQVESFVIKCVDAQSHKQL